MQAIAEFLLLCFEEFYYSTQPRRQSRLYIEFGSLSAGAGEGLEQNMVVVRSS